LLLALYSLNKVITFILMVSLKNNLIMTHMVAVFSQVLATL